MRGKKQTIKSLQIRITLVFALFVNVGWNADRIQILNLSFLFYNRILKMDQCLSVGEGQPKDIPFTRSENSQKYIGVRYQNNNYLTAIVVFICFSAIYYGYCLSFVSAIAHHDWEHFFGKWAGQSSTLGWLIGCFPLGGAIGSGLARLFIKLASRKKILIICSACAVVVAGIIQINNIYLLLAFRVIQGIIVGNYMAVTPLFINEITPLDLRGSKGVFSQIMIVVGIVIAYFFKVVLTVSHAHPEFYWRFVFAFSGLAPLVQFFLLIFNFIPESPMSLIEEGKMKQAKEVIAMFNVKEVVNDVLAQMIHEAKAKERNKIAKQNQDTATPGGQETVQQKGNPHQQSEVRLQMPPEQKGVKLPPIRRASRKLSKKEQLILNKTMQIYKSEKNIQPEVQKILQDHHSEHEPVPKPEPEVTTKALLLGVELHFMQQFSGIKMIITEINVIFAQYNPAIALFIPLISNIVQLVAAFFSSAIVSRFGRKNITVFGNISLSIILVIIAVLFVISDRTKDINLIYAAVALIILFMVGYTTTIGPVVWLYVPEMIPHHYVPVASIFNWLASSTCVIVTPYVLLACGSPYPVFFFFGAILFVFFLINITQLVETKGLTPHEVAQKFQQKKAEVSNEATQ